MTDTAPHAEAMPTPTFEFLRDGSPEPQQLDWTSGPGLVRKAVGEALNARNVAFLLGAGCSSMRDANGAETGIATMEPLAKEFCAASAEDGGVDEEDDGEGEDLEAPAEAAGSPGEPAWVLSKDERAYLAKVGVSLKDPHYERNLERLMEALHSLHFVLHHSWKDGHEKRAKTVQSIIEKVKLFLWERCTNGAFAHGDSSVLDLYEKFYRRLVFRDRSLPRPWVFTTNYDLFNERAMDRLGLPLSLIHI